MGARCRIDAVNLGCGRFYRAGHVNVDAHDRTAADLVADALRLPFASRSLALVRADHFVEHFDWGKAPFLLSECFRVLRPGGRLVLETPDPDESCRRFLSARDGAEREACLAWILGRPSPGYSHRWLHDRSSLERLSSNAGFEAIRFELPETHRYGPGLHLEAVRSASQLHEVVAELRHGVPRESIEDPDEAREIECRFFDNVRAAISPKSEDFPARLWENALLSLELSERWVSLLVRHGAWSSQEAAPIAAFLCVLREAGLQDFMERAFVRLCERTNAVSDGYDFLLERAGALIAEGMAGARPPAEAALREASRLPLEAGRPRPDVVLEAPEELRNLDHLQDPEGPEDLPARSRAGSLLPFTRARLEREVVGWRDKGVRLLSSGRLEEAESLLRRAFNAKLRYFYTAWNLAVLRTIQGDLLTAAAYYRVALRFEHPGPEEDLRRALVLCLLRCGRLEEASAEIEKLPGGPVREELEACLRSSRSGRRDSDPSPPTEAVPPGKGIWS